MFRDYDYGIVGSGRIGFLGIELPMKSLCNEMIRWEGTKES